MVFITIPQVFGIDPMPAFIPPTTASTATAVGAAIRAAIAQSPRSFTRALPVAGETGYAQSPLMRDLWNDWAGVGGLPQPPTALPEGQVDGQVYTWGAVVRWTLTETGQSVDFEAGFFRSPPNYPGYYGPLIEGPTARIVNGNWGMYITYVPSQGAAPISESVVTGFPATTHDEPKLISWATSPMSNPTAYLPTQYPNPEPLIDPATIPLHVPIPVTLPIVPGIRPVPYVVPTFLPSPFRLPFGPIPLLPGSPGEPDINSPVPNIDVYPDGIEVGMPSGGQSNQGSRPRIPAETPTINIDAERVRNPPAVAECLGDDPPSDCCDCDDIREIVYEELDKKFPPKRPVNGLIDVSGAANNAIVDLPEYSRYIKLITTTSMLNEKGQSGGGFAPDVVYLGWCSFAHGSGGGERIPISYERQTLSVPVGADKFTYTMYHGAEAQVEIHYDLGAL